MLNFILNISIDNNQEVTMYKKVMPIFLVVLFVAAFQLTSDENKIGVVQSVRGSAVAVADGQKRSLSHRDGVYVQDLLAIGKNGFLQVMFKDGTILAMRENSEVELRQFEYEIGSADESVVDINMISGGIRFLTGNTVKGNPEGFAVETPLGTIGIRGTEGTADTQLTNADEYNANLNQNISAPGTGWNRTAQPDVANQSVNHINGSISRVMTFTDMFRKTVSLNRGQGVDVNRETGAGAPRSNTNTQVTPMQVSTFNKKAPIPKRYANQFGGYEGGGRPGANTVSTGSGREKEKTDSSNSCP